MPIEEEEEEEEEEDEEEEEEEEEEEYDDVMRGTQAESVRERGSEEDSWAQKERGNRGVEKTI